jgi:hypothetical protein
MDGVLKRIIAICNYPNRLTCLVKPSLEHGISLVSLDQTIDLNPIPLAILDYMVVHGSILFELGNGERTGNFKLDYLVDIVSVHILAGIVLPVQLFGILHS